MDGIVLLLGMLYSLLGGLGNHCLDYVDTEAYWSSTEVELTEDALIGMIEEVEREVPAEEELDRLVADLSAPAFDKRTDATAALLKLGEAARPFLEKSASEIKDPGALAAIRAVLDKFDSKDEFNRKHRLMAIRTLGELKYKDAVPHLEKLLKSEDAFVGELSARALAEIRGEEYVPKAVEVPGIEAGVNLVSSSVAGVIHAKLGPRQKAGMQLNELLAMMAAIDVEPDEVEGAVEEVKVDIADAVMEMLYFAGGFRLDSVTAVMPDDFDFEEEKFCVFVVVRGEFDTARLTKSATEELGAKVIEGVEWFGDADEGYYVHLASKNLLVIAYGSELESNLKEASLRISGKLKEPATGHGLELAKEHQKDAPLVITFGSARPDTWLSHLASIYLTFHPGENGSGELKFSFTASADRKGQRLLGKVWKGIARLKWAGRITDSSAGLPKDAPSSVGPIKAEENGLTLRGEAAVQRASAMVIPLMLYRYFEFF